MNHRFALTALLALAMTVGCSSPSEESEEIESSVSALETCENADGMAVECDGAGKGAYVLTSFNASTGVLTGYNQLGGTFSAQLTNATHFHKANLNKYIPGEPYRPSLVQYNATIHQGPSFSQIATLVSFGISARVTAKGGKVKQFRPVPGL